jgi:outer membrane receptor protein involved in Fe transport
MVVVFPDFRENQVMSFRRIVKVAFVVLLAFAMPQSRLAEAQTSTGTISGVVTDASGGVVANAEAKATNEATGQTWTAASGTSGEFQLQNLPPGSYAVEVSAAGFQVFRANKIGVSVGSAYNLPVRLAVESARKVVIVHGEVADDYKPTAMAIGNLSSQPLQELPISGLVVTRSLLDDQQARLLSDVAKNDASVGEDYAPVGYYQDFEIRGFPLDLASGIKINGLSAAGEQLIALENKDAVEFLHGVDSDEVGVASGGGLVNGAVSSRGCQ